MIDALQGMRQQQSLLFWSTIYTAALLVPSLALLLLDTRVVTGVNRWLKVVKFEVSILALNLTAGWMLAQLSLPGEAATEIGGIIGITMALEITAIVIQAARGVPSHYNMSTPLNGAIFASMGIAISINTLAMAWLCALSFSPQPQMAPALLWGVRLGLILFLMSSLQGFQMVGKRGHTVGARDGGPGLPGVRWSTVAGDLRIAHFVGLHGIQVLPLLGYIASRTDQQAGVPLVMSVFVILTAGFAWTLWQALAGRPLLARQR